MQILTSRYVTMIHNPKSVQTEFTLGLVWSKITFIFLESVTKLSHFLHFLRNWISSRIFLKTCPGPQTFYISGISISKSVFQNFLQIFWLSQLKIFRYTSFWKISEIFVHLQTQTKDIFLQILTSRSYFRTHFSVFFSKIDFQTE